MQLLLVVLAALLALVEVQSLANQLVIPNREPSYSKHSTLFYCIKLIILDEHLIHIQCTKTDKIWKICAMNK